MLRKCVREYARVIGDAIDVLQLSEKKTKKNPHGGIVQFCVQLKTLDRSLTLSKGQVIVETNEITTAFFFFEHSHALLVFIYY